MSPTGWPCYSSLCPLPHFFPSQTKHGICCPRCLILLLTLPFVPYFIFSFSDKTWDMLCRMSNLTAFDGFRLQFKTQLEDWRRIYDSKEPQRETLPQPWNENLTEFQKMLVIRVLRPDKVSERQKHCLNRGKKS